MMYDSLTGRSLAPRLWPAWEPQTPMPRKILEIDYTAIETRILAHLELEHGKGVHNALEFMYGLAPKTRRSSTRPLALATSTDLLLQEIYASLRSSRFRRISRPR